MFDWIFAIMLLSLSIYLGVTYTKTAKQFATTIMVIVLLVVGRAAWAQYSDILDNGPYSEGASCQSEFDAIRMATVEGITISGSIDSAYEKSLEISLMYNSMLHKELVGREDVSLFGHDSFLHPEEFQIKRVENLGNESSPKTCVVVFSVKKEFQDDGGCDTDGRLYFYVENSAKTLKKIRDLAREKIQNG